MKLTWPTGIIIAFTGFAIFIGSLVFKAFQQRVDLVSEDYYAKEIKFQDQLEKMNNTGTSSDLLCVVSGDKVKIQFPVSASPAGNLYFLRPSDSRLDVSETIAASEKGEQFIDLTKFNSGKYKLQADWEVKGRKYYSEKIIVIP